MAFNGTGTFSRLYNWVSDAASGINIRADRSDNELDGIATGLSTAICKDGQTTTTAVIPFAFGLSAAALVDLSNAAAGQVSFPAVQNASAGVNVLDDYEEGTWTPSLGGTTTYTTQTGTYTKVGRLVYFNCELSINAIGTGSATTISGLPFTSTAILKSLSVGYFAGVATSVVSLMAYVFPSSATIKFSCMTALGPTPTDVPNIFASGTRVNLSGCYETT